MYLLVHAAWRQIIGISELFQNEAQDLDWTIFRIGNLGNGKFSPFPVGGDGLISVFVEAQLGRFLRGILGMGIQV